MFGKRWLSGEVDDLLRPIADEVRPQRRLRRLAAPTWQGTVIVVALVALLVPLGRLIATYWPGQALNLVDSTQLDPGYLALWQVQAGVAAVALPVLLFVIERSRDEPQAAATSTEVLILKSFAFPIMVFSLAVAVNIGINIARGETSTVFLIDLVLFALTCLLTVVAYFQVVRLLFNPSELRRESRNLKRAQAIESVLDSLRSRASLRVLAITMRDIGLAFDPAAVRQGSGRVALRSQKDGVVTDVDLNGLQSFMKTLPWKPESSDASRPSAVWLATLPDHGIRTGDPLVALEPAHFGVIDRLQLEREINRVFRIA